MLFFLGPDENNRLIVCSLPIRLTSRGLRNFEFTELVVTASAEAASHLFRLSRVLDNVTRIILNIRELSNQRGNP